MQIVQKHGLIIHTLLTSDNQAIFASKADFLACVKEILENVSPELTFTEEDCKGIL